MSLKRAGTIGWIALAVTVSAVSSSQCAEPPPAKGQGYIDVHAHLWGRYKTGGSGGPGIMPAGAGVSGAKSPGERTPSGKPQGDHPPTRGVQYGMDYEAAAKALLGQMDQYGVAKALLMPPPRTRENVDPVELRELLAVAKRHPDRFAVAGGGDVLNPMIQERKASEVTAQIRAEFEMEAEHLAKSGVKAFGEMAALHLSFTEMHVFEETSPDHPLFLALSDIAARHNLPIDLHMEAVPEEMDLPPRLERLSKNNPPKLKANIAAFEKLLAHNAKARIVWQHIGWDNTGRMTIELLRRLLNAHPNLYMALRVVEHEVGPDGRPLPNRIVDHEWNIRPEWQKLFEEFPDRFVIGTDEFVGVPGKSGTAPQSFEETWRILKQLPPELADKIGRSNAARIYGLD